MNAGPSRLLIGLAACLALGCATPVEVKTASRSQTELVAALGEAVSNLSAAVEDFHRAKEARIREEGRMIVARQAIDAAFPPDVKRAVTADGLFADYKKSIQPWIDHALSGPDIDAEIASLEKRIAAIPANPPSVVRVALEARLDDLKLQKAQLSRPPRPVQDAQVIILRDIANEQATAAAVKKALGLLAADVDVMKAAALTVDQWLAIDVTPNQEQVGALMKLLSTPPGGPR